MRDGLVALGLSNQGNLSIPYSGLTLAPQSCQPRLGLTLEGSALASHWQRWERRVCLRSCEFRPVDVFGAESLSTWGAGGVCVKVQPFRLHLGILPDSCAVARIPGPASGRFVFPASRDAGGTLCKTPQKLKLPPFHVLAVFINPHLVT